MREGIPVLRGALPLFGHLPSLHRRLRDVVRDGERENGPVFWLNLGFGRWVICAAHADAWQLMKSKGVSSEHAREKPVIDFLGARSLIALDGAEHARVRGALNPTFSPRGLTGLDLGPAFAEIIRTRLSTWAQRGTISLLAETRELVLSLMFRMAGVEGAELSEWRRHYERLAWLAVNMPDIPGSPRWFAKRSRDWLDARVRELIAEARANPSTGLISALVAARDEHGAALDEQQLVENTRLLILAGHETSASTMAWATALLAVHQDAWKRLCDEALAAPDLPRTPGELKAFPFAEAMFREALRLYPPVSFDMRRVVTELEIAGVSLPLGADVLIPLATQSRDAGVYPDPDRFAPDRWLDKRTAPTAVELVQFGAGPHFCLGYHVAWLEIVQFLVALARVLGAAGLRPSLHGRFPEPRFIPLTHPPSSLRIRVA